MYRGTTPTITFTLPDKVDLTDIHEIWVTFKNYYQTFTVKYTEGRVTIDSENNKISVELTQEETLTLSAGDIYMQLRICTMDHKAFVADPKRVFKLHDILEDGVID